MAILKRSFLGFLSVAALLCVFSAYSRGEEATWQNDFDAAKAKAKAEKKLMLVDFTGSDWCIWCKKLHEEVFSKEPFASDAPKQFVLVELDYPHEKKQSDELKAQNKKLAKEYKIRGYPTVLLMDASGEVIAHTGYRAGGPEKYVANLSKLVKAHEDILKMQEELANSKGLDRAKLLDRMVEATSELDSDSKNIETWSKEIVELDPDNKAGLKNKYEIRQLMVAITAAINDRNLDDAMKIVDEVLAKPNLSGDQKQEALFAQGYLLQAKRQIRPAIVSLKKALEAAPDGPKAEQIGSFLPYLENMIKGEENALKAKDALAKAEGDDKLELLDKAVQAYAKVGNRIDGKDQSAEVLGWEKEIIKLDADNKAGLKVKYEYQIAISEAQKLMMARKGAEALAAVDKALSLPGLADDQVERGTLLKCSCLMMQKDYQGAIDCAKKGLENAHGMMATAFKQIIKQAEAKLPKAKEDAEVKPNESGKTTDAGKSARTGAKAG